MVLEEFQRIVDPRDEEITFYLGVYRDCELARWCLGELRKHYPQSRVIMISDGDDDPRYLELAVKHNVDYTQGERLYVTTNGGKIVHRMLKHFVEDPTRWLIKIDTDTCVHRRFRYLPAGKVIFGTLRHQTQGRGVSLSPPSVQGGCIGFSRAAAEEMYNSCLFELPNLLDYKSTYAKGVSDIVSRAQSGLVSFDFLVRYGFKELNIPIIDFDEVKSVWRGNVDNSDLRYAITHPHKNEGRMKQWKNQIRSLLSTVCKY